MNEQLKIIISAEVDKLKKAVADAKSEVNKLSDESENAGNKIDEAMKSAGESCKTAFATIGKALIGVGTALAGVAIATQEYRDDIAKLNTAFEAAGMKTGTAKTAYQDLYRVLGETDQAVEASQQIALLATSEESVAKWSELAAGVVGKFGDALQPETFYEAANETMALGEATGAFTQMLEGCHMSVDEFNKGLAECKTETEKEAYMLEWTEKCLGENAEAFKKNNAEVLAQRDAQMKLQEQLAAVGEAIAPLVTAFTAFGAEALAVVAPYIKQIAEDYAPKLKTVLEEVATALGNAFEWASQHKALLMVIGGIILTVVTAIGLYNVAAGIKVAMAAAEVTSVWALVAAYTAQAAAMLVALAPYILIVAAIAAVIAIIVLCVKHWDKIKETVVNVAKAVWEKVKEMVDKVVQFFQQIIDWISNNWQSLLLLIVNPFAGAFKLAYDNCEQFREKVNTVFTNIKDGVKSRIEALKENVKSIFNQVKTLITTPIENAKTTVKAAVDKIKSFFNFKWGLPKPSIPKFSVSGGKAPWGFGGKGSLPKISIRWNKLGGIFDKPTLFNYGGSLQGIGEDGAEAVVPLEKNTKWLDKLADRITAKQGNTPIVLQVDGKTFAQVSIDSINALTRQRGSLGLNIV